MAGAKRKHSDGKIGWGVIGCGGIADKRTIPGLLLSPQARLVGVHNPGEATTRKIAGKYKCLAFKTIKELLAAPEIDAVYLASPVVCHPEQVTAAADAGKHVLCEKPLAVELDACRRLLDHCERRQVHFMLGFMMRFHPIHQMLAKWVSRGDLGRIIMARAQLSHHHVEYNPDGSRNWRQDPAQSGGGALMDMGIHAVDLLRMIVGREVEEVSGNIATLRNDYAVEDTGILTLTFDDGSFGIVDSTFAVRGAQHVLELYGTNASVFVDNSLSQIEEGNIYVVKEGRKQKHPYRKRRHFEYRMYTSEIDAMNVAILEKRPPVFGAREGIIAQAIVQTGYRSSRLGQRLKIPPI